MDAKTTSLDEIKLFFDDRNRRVHCYRRIEDITWVFDETRSRKLSDIYDDAKAKLQGKPSRVRFSDDPIPLPDDQEPASPAPSPQDGPLKNGNPDYWWNGGDKPTEEDML